MTSPGEMLEPWKSTAATLFNPYLNLNQISTSVPRQSSIRTRILTPARHVRAPAETLIGLPANKRLASKPFPSPTATEDVSLYVQQMIHNQFCGRSGTPSDQRYEQTDMKRSKSTPSRQTVSSHQHPSRGKPSFFV